MSSYKIVVLGSGSVGKSALTVRLVSNHFLAVYDPTVEESYRTQTTIDNEPAVLEIIDTAGQEEYNAIKEAHVVKSQGFLLVFSLTSRQSFDDLEAIHATIYRLKEKDPAKDDIPMVIAGNKCDLEADRCVAITEGEDLAKSWRCIFHPSLFPFFSCFVFPLSPLSFLVCVLTSVCMCSIGAVEGGCRGGVLRHCEDDPPGAGHEAVGRLVGGQQPPQDVHAALRPVFLHAHAHAHASTRAGTLFTDPRPQSLLFLSLLLMCVFVCFLLFAFFCIRWCVE